MKRLLLASTLLLAACGDGQAGQESDEEYVTVEMMCEIVAHVHADVRDVGGTAEQAWRATDGREDFMPLPWGVAGRPAPLPERYEFIDDLCGEKWAEVDQELRWP